MMYKRLVAAALVFGMASTGPPVAAQAQINCGARSQVIKVLKQQHRETILGVGVASPNAIYEVWRAKKSGSWTILMTKPNNISCIMATGRNWMEAPKTPTPARQSIHKALAYKSGSRYHSKMDGQCKAAILRSSNANQKNHAAVFTPPL